MATPYSPRFPASGLARSLSTALGAILLACSSAHAAEPPWRSIFNGHDLTGWEGRPGVWSAEEGGVLRGASHGLTLSNTFLVYRGRPVRDFHLKLQVRLTNGNSGIQYRARDLGGWVVSGYQAEIANEPGKAGFLYEERGRKFVAFLGQSVAVSPAGGLLVQSRTGRSADFVGWHYYEPRAWNRYEIIARGAWMAHYVNGFKTAEFFDTDPERAAREGVLALQIHAGPPMTVEFRDLLLRSF